MFPIMADPLTAAVQKLYDTYPFPPEPLSDQPPPGYNWRWSWPAAYSFCTGRAPKTQAIKILDAGCGTGVGTEYLAYLNPEAQITAVDLSQGALTIAQERIHRLGAKNVTFHQASLLDDALELPGPFDLINCVGVLHHLQDPVRGLANLAKQLGPGGIFHIFVYGELGRWEIKLMQEAIQILQGDQRGDYTGGVQLGRQIFAALPAQNRLKQRETERWAMENIRDECFADMYVHPQEVDYTIPTLFTWLETTDLEFLGFSNPVLWQIERVLGANPELCQRAAHLSPKEKYRLIELLDPSSITHYEFFLGRPPLPHHTWTELTDLLGAIPTLHPCIDGWPGNCLFNSFYELIHLTDGEMAFLQACQENQAQSVQAVLPSSSLNIAQVYSLWQRQLILLTPSAGSTKE